MRDNCELSKFGRYRSHRINKNKRKKVINDICEMASYLKSSEHRIAMNEKHSNASSVIADVINTLLIIADDNGINAASVLTVATLRYAANHGFDDTPATVAIYAASKSLEAFLDLADMARNQLAYSVVIPATQHAKIHTIIEWCGINFEENTWWLKRGDDSEYLFVCETEQTMSLFKKQYDIK